MIYERKSLTGYEGLYEIDTNGAVYSIAHNNSRRSGIKKDYDNGNGYRRIRLYDNYGNAKAHFVHRLVASTFMEQPSAESVVNHINADKTDNRLANLEWLTQKENISKSRILGLQKDRTVIVNGQITFSSIADAAEALTGKRSGFMYLRKKYGDQFTYAGQKVEVI